MGKSPFLGVIQTKDNNFFDIASGSFVDPSTIVPRMAPFYGRFYDKDGVEHDLLDYLGDSGGSGVIGPQGPQGPPGPQGIPGPMPTIVDNLTSTSSTIALSANMGRALNQKTTDIVDGTIAVGNASKLGGKLPSNYALLADANFTSLKRNNNDVWDKGNLIENNYMGTLLNGWGPLYGNSFYQPQFTRIGNIVSLNAVMEGTIITQGLLLFYVPAWAIPKTIKYFVMINAYDGSAARITLGVQSDAILLDSGVKPGNPYHLNVTYSLL